MSRRYVDSLWGQVHLRSSGIDGPPIALFHETPLSSAVFSRTLPHLGVRCRAIALDTPGYGASDPPPDPPEIPGYAAVLFTAIDRLFPDERIALCGSHTGASIALAVAELAGTDRVGAIVLSGLPLFDAAERRRLEATYAPRLRLDREASHFRWAWEEYLGTEGGPGPEPPLEIVNLAATHIAANHDRYAWGYRAAFRFDPSPIVEAFDAPMLLLGTSGDVLAPFDDVAANLRPDMRRVRMEGVRNRPYWHLPESFADNVISFLEEVGPW